MLCIISPAKSLDENASFPGSITPSQPRFLPQTKTLLQALQKCDAPAIQKLMGVSEKIATLNVARYKHFPKILAPENAKPAIYLFQGDVYKSLDITSLPDAMLAPANNRLRILSGLYGLLRPFDLAYPYRLEMGLKFQIAAHKNLYHFWGSQIAQQLNADAQAAHTDILINLASNEYSKAVDKTALHLREVTVHFKEQKAGQLKIIGIMAKRARGAMARFICEQNPQTPKDLQHFTAGGYQFKKDLSSENELVFVRS
jgi:cytoplasmic iron level regulating protein YaaA (DUF328/UPF0246 family)